MRVGDRIGDWAARLRGVALRTVAATLGLASLSAMAADKPNILIIWGDDIGISNISATATG